MSVVTGIETISGGVGCRFLQLRLCKSRTRRRTRCVLDTTTGKIDTVNIINSGYDTSRCYTSDKSITSTTIQENLLGLSLC